MKDEVLKNTNQFIFLAICSLYGRYLFYPKIENLVILFHIQSVLDASLLIFALLAYGMTKQPENVLVNMTTIFNISGSAILKAYFSTLLIPI